jgi:hypothetical protein
MSCRQNLVVSQFEGDHPSGAKAHADFVDVNGTAEAVPFQNIPNWAATQIFSFLHSNTVYFR